MTTPSPTTSFADPAPAQRLERATAALTAHGFTAEILDDAAAARTRVKELIPAGAVVFTGASETLRLSGIEEDINAGGRYEAIKPRVLSMDRATQADDIRRLLVNPDVVVGSVAALTETGSLVVASGSGSQLPAYMRRCRAGDLDRRCAEGGTRPHDRTAARTGSLPPLESARTREAYGRPSAVNRLLILNAEHQPGRGTVLLLREAIGF